MQAKLVVVEPLTQPDEYLVTLPATIGRGQEATLKLAHALISRQHCELFADQGRIMVRDLGSLNGTFVGGQRVETAPLSSGELLTIGSVTLRVVYGDNLALAASARKNRAVVTAVETISMEDTAQASHRPDDNDDFLEPEDYGDNDPKNFFRNMN
jgi:pSer/pThr/pTyr-binding forkhead associated (FHA) protein